MAWIQVHQQLKDHRKLLASADELEVPPAHMLGMLISFWLWALDNAPTGSLAGISNRMIARAAQWDGDPDIFVKTLAKAGLLDTDGEGSLMLHDWYEYAGKLIDQREAEKNRSRARRASTAGRPPDDRQTTGGRVDQSRVDQSREEKTREDNGDHNPLPPKGGPAADPVPYKAIVDLYHEICTSYPRLRAVEGKRKQAIAARWKKYHDLDVFAELFDRAQNTPFLNGDNDRGWTATFDWLINPTNMSKVLEGNYDGLHQQPRTAAQKPKPKKADTMGVLAGIIAGEEGGAAQ